jgi:hypothetical protein
LTDLEVTLTGGRDAAFVTGCTPPSGTATATLTSYGDSRAVVSSPFTVSRCTAPAGGGGGGGGGGTGPGSPTGRSHAHGRPKIEPASISGLARGVPAIRFKLHSGRHAAKLRSFAIELPRGLRFVRHRLHKRLKLTGVSIKGAKVRSLVLKGGRLVVTLRRPVNVVVVKIGPKALKESTALKRDAGRHHLKRLKLTVVITDAAGHRTTVTQLVKST